jgi:pimeloyl-ACP methyl ester carboxylesterase
MRGRTLTFVAIAGYCAFGLFAGPTEAESPARKLELVPCKIEGLTADARCGTYEVFENRAAGTGRKIPLRVVVVPADAPQRQPDAVAYFAGGPGESAVEDGSWLMEILRSKGPQARDVLLVDLRGTGQSAPLLCTELMGMRNLQGFLDNFFTVEAVRSCREKLSRTTDLTQYTSEIAADDFDEVRAALGYGKLNLFAGSYGTRTALVYMRRYPSRVRTASLFGVVANDAPHRRRTRQSARRVHSGLPGLDSREARPRLPRPDRLRCAHADRVGRARSRDSGERRQEDARPPPSRHPGGSGDGAGALTVRGRLPAPGNRPRSRSPAQIRVKVMRATGMDFPSF